MHKISRTWLLVIFLYAMFGDVVHTMSRVSALDYRSFISASEGVPEFQVENGVGPGNCGYVPYHSTILNAPLVSRELVVGNNTMFYFANKTRFPSWTPPTNLPLYECINATKACTFSSYSNLLFSNFINGKFLGDVGPAQRFFSTPSNAHQVGTAVCPLGYETGRGYAYDATIMTNYGYPVNQSGSTSDTALNLSGNKFAICNNHRYGVTRMQYIDPSSGKTSWAFYFKVTFGGNVSMARGANPYNKTVSRVYLTGPFNTLTPTSKTWVHPSDPLPSRQMNFSNSPIVPSAYATLVASYTGTTAALNAASLEPNVYHLFMISDTDLGNSPYQIVIEWSNGAYVENPDVFARRVLYNQPTPYDLWKTTVGAVIPKYNLGVLPSYTLGFQWTDFDAQDGSLLLSKKSQVVYRLDLSNQNLSVVAQAIASSRFVFPTQVNTVQLATVYNLVNFTGDFPEVIVNGLDDLVNVCHGLGFAVLLETAEQTWQNNVNSVLYRINTGWKPSNPPTSVGQSAPTIADAGYISPSTFLLELSTPLLGAYGGLTAIELYHNWLIQYHHIDGIVHDAVPNTQVPITYSNKTILPHYASEVFLYHTLPMPFISVSNSYLPVYLINTTEASIYPCGVPSVYYYTDNGLNMLTGALQPLGVPLFQGSEQLVNLQVLIPADIRAFSWLLFPLAPGQTPLVPYSITLNSTSPYLTPTLQYPAPLSSVEWLAIWMTERMLNGQTPVVPQGFEEIIFTQGGLACFNLRYTVHPNFFHVDSFRWDITALRYTTHSPEYATIPMDDELDVMFPPSIAQGLKLSWTMYALPPLPVGVVRQDEQEGVDDSYSYSSSDSSSYSSSFDEDIVVDCNCATSTDIYPPDTNDDGVGDYYPPACIIAQTNYLSSNQTHIMKFDNNDAIETANFFIPLPNNTIPLILGASDPPVCTIITITGARFYNCTMPPSSYILSLFNPTVAPVPSSSQPGLWPPYIWLTILLIFIVVAALLIVLIVMLRRTNGTTAGANTAVSYSRVRTK